MKSRSAQEGGDEWWRAWVTPAVLLSLLTGAVTFGAAVLALGYLLFLRFPDVENRVDGMEAKQAKFFATLSDDESRRFEVIDSQLSAIRTNLVRLCAKGNQLEKACQTKELMTVVSGIAQAHAAQFVSARVSVRSGKLPEISSPELRKELASSHEESLFPKANEATAKVASTLVLSSVADDSAWTVSDGKLQATFANGVATFEPKSSTSQADLQEISAEMSKVSDVLRESKSSTDPVRSVP